MSGREVSGREQTNLALQERGRDTGDALDEERVMGCRMAGAQHGFSHSIKALAARTLAASCQMALARCAVPIATTVGVEGNSAQVDELDEAELNRQIDASIIKARHSQPSGDQVTGARFLSTGADLFRESGVADKIERLLEEVEAGSISPDQFWFRADQVLAGLDQVTLSVVGGLLVRPQGPHSDRE